MVESLDWDAVGVMTSEGNREPSVLSNQNETLMMGFGEYLVTEVGVQVKSAKQYVTNIKTQLSTSTGYDPSYGMDWLRLRRLWNRLETEYPGEAKVREPILQQHLLEIRLKLDMEKRICKMYWAAVLMLFFVVGRKSDHFASSRDSFNSKVDTTRSDVRYVNEDLIMVDIKQTKTRRQDRNHPGKPLVRDSGNPLCPVSALEEYFSEDVIQEWEDPNVIPLFRHEDGAAVSGDDMHRFVKLATESIGLKQEHYGSHSLRIGGATAALACSKGDEYSVKVMGMWVSQSVQLYTRPTMNMMSDLLLEMMRKKETTPINGM